MNYGKNRHYTKEEMEQAFKDGYNQRKKETSGCGDCKRYQLSYNNPKFFEKDSCFSCKRRTKDNWEPIQ